MNLGMLMERLADESDAVFALESIGNLPLFAAVSEMGDRHGETPGEYVANASRRFALLAGDEDWLALMTAMERAAIPGQAALERMLGWALDRDERELSAELPTAGGCGCGGGAGGCHGHSHP